MSTQSFKSTRDHQRYLERIHWMDEQLRSRKFLSVKDIQNQFGLVDKTVRRDLAFLRDRLYRPLEYVAAERAWRYTTPVNPLLSVTLTEGELATILLSERLARAYAGSWAAEQIEAILAKVAGALTDSISIELSQLSTLQTVEPLPSTDIDQKLFGTFVEAIQTRTQVEMTYFTQSSGKVSTRRVDPLHLHSSKGEWYVIAFDHNRHKVLDFHLGRIREYSLTSERFEIPETFDLQAVLDSGFGMFRGSGDRLYDVVIEFDAYQAGWIAQQSKVHRTAEYTPLDGGGLRVTMRVGALEGVKMWLLQYGAHVKVIEPEELREMIYSEAQRMVRLYNQ